MFTNLYFLLKAKSKRIRWSGMIGLRIGQDYLIDFVHAWCERITFLTDKMLNGR